ncbi:MAG: phosphatidate cytidylyltransferase [Chitinispirillia bacterium]|nr:phosphatidate cytidylyltransferase [Chitinispirillia bacterium]MCL2267573.1 phosphatidate cytidylyltransferase [Chitinispirillia bacterium]
MINTANLKKRLLFVAVAVPIGFFVVNSRIDLLEPLLRLFDMGADWLPKDLIDTLYNKEKLPPIIYPGQLLALALVMLGAYEYTKMMSIFNKKNAFWLGHIWIFVMSTAYLINYSIPSTISNAMLLLIVVFEAFVWGKEAPQGRWKRASLFFLGTMFLSIASVSLMSLFREPFSTLFNPPAIPMMGRLDLIVVITAVFFCDSAAYFVGSTVGKRKLTSISPNKTVEGSLAGLAASILMMSICWIFLRNPEYPIITGIIMGALIGVTAQIGDLLMSLVKRYFKVKDASHIIPGHGGILDRFDSLFFAAPVLYLFAWLLTR